MTLYCDTSVMVSVFAAEAQSDAVRAWLARQSGAIIISAWVVTEFSGALAMKRRMGVVDAAGWDGVMQAWRRFCESEVVVQPVIANDFARGAALMDRGDLKLRSADALHLAIVMNRGWSLATLDHDLANAGAQAGVTLDRVLG